MAFKEPSWLVPPCSIHGPEGRDYQLLDSHGDPGSHGTAFVCVHDGGVYVAKLFRPGAQVVPASVRRRLHRRGLTPEQQASMAEAAVMIALQTSYVPLDHLVRIVDRFEDRGLSWLILAYCDWSLDRAITLEVWDGPRYFHRLAQGLLYALDALHNAGYVHRDVILENVFVSNLDRCLEPECFDFKLGDFGHVRQWNYHGREKSKDIAKDLHAASTVLIKAWYGSASVFTELGSEATILGLPAGIRAPLRRAQRRELKTDCSAADLLVALGLEARGAAAPWSPAPSIGRAGHRW
jgi:serine/threonine protein kinase